MSEAPTEAASGVNVPICPASPNLATCRYLADMAAELAEIASASGQAELAFLLDMARHEADRLAVDGSADA